MGACGVDIFCHKASVACRHHHAAHQRPTLSVHVAHQRTRGSPGRDCICHICHMLSGDRTALPWFVTFVTSCHAPTDTTIIIWMAGPCGAFLDTCSKLSANHILKESIPCHTKYSMEILCKWYSPGGSIPCHIKYSRKILSKWYSGESIDEESWYRAVTSSPRVMTRTQEREYSWSHKI